MRRLVGVFLFLALSTSAFAQKGEFPLVAKVVSSDTEVIPVGTSTSTSQSTAMPGTIWEAPQRHANTTVQYGGRITVTAEVGNAVYRLWAPRLFTPGDYPANLQKNCLLVLAPDKKGKLKTFKLHIASVSEKKPT